MVLDVQFRRLFGVMNCVMGVSLRRVSVVRGGLVIASLVMPGGFAMVFRRVVVVVRCVLVVLRCLLRHRFLPTLDCPAMALDAKPCVLRECDVGMKTQVDVEDRWWSIGNGRWRVRSSALDAVHAPVSPPPPRAGRRSPLGEGQESGARWLAHGEPSHAIPPIPPIRPHSAILVT
jgi:hypothetical protein